MNETSEPREYIAVHYASRSAMKKNRRRHLFSKVIVVSLLLTIVAYVATVFYFVWNGIYPPDSLTYTFLPAVIGQLGIMSTITKKDKDVEIAEINNETERRTHG